MSRGIPDSEPISKSKAERASPSAAASKNKESPMLVAEAIRRVLDAKAPGSHEKPPGDALPLIRLWDSADIPEFPPQDFTKRTLRQFIHKLYRLRSLIRG